VKEGGGGDNLAVAWKGPGDGSAFADGDLPIGGEFLSGFAPLVTELDISISTDADGNVVVTWTGTLQSATDVTGPWSDVADDSQSPLTLTPDQARLFGRAIAP
jgi:hypothetical protein